MTTMTDLKWRVTYLKPHPVEGSFLVEHSSKEVVQRDLGPAIDAPLPEGAVERRYKLLNPPDIRMGDMVRYRRNLWIGWQDEADVVGTVTRRGQPFDGGQYNVDIKDAGTGETVTAPCEYCEVVFRPHAGAWTGDEVGALAVRPSPGTAGAFDLHGAAPGRTARLIPLGEGLWNSWHVAFMDGQVCRDSMTVADVREGAAAANAWIFGHKVEVGDSFLMSINQGMRFCGVTAVKKLRYRIEYDMPNAGTMGSWRTGVRIAGALYRPIDRWHGKAGR